MLIVALVVLVTASVAFSARAKPGEAAAVRVGVLAYRGVDHAVRSWTPMVRYLTRRIPERRFVVVPLPLDELSRATKNGEIDYVFTNSGQYVMLEEAVGISRIATLKKAISSGVSNVYGAVIFSRADRRDIRRLADLKGKVLAAVSDRAFGGFQMAWRELKAAGIDPFDDLKEIRFQGFPQDDIVFKVRDGEVDAGTVRTDVLETMADNDKIDLADFRILNRRAVPGHRMALSTRLYPEWPLASTPHMPAELSEKVALALLSLPSDSPEMLAAGYPGWTVPLDYKPVHDLFRDLEIGPYAPRDAGIFDALRRHWEWVLFASTLLVLIIFHGIRTEQQVLRRTRQLSDVNRELEHEIQERRSAEERARQHEAELAHVSRVNVIGEMTSGLAHELRQPLAAIRNYAEGGIRRLKRRNGDAGELREALTQIAEQAGRAGQIIARVRGYMRKRQPRREAVDLNRAVEEAVSLLRHDAVNAGVEVTLDLAPELPAVTGDLIEFEQVIINLGRNAIDAMAEEKAGPRRLTISTGAADGVVSVTVGDSGPGLAADEAERIWQPFVTSKDSGLGLGLSICRSIIDAHGGRISAETPAGGGFSVSFSIPTPATGEAADDAA